jgi:hypothetical protein
MSILATACDCASASALQALKSIHRLSFRTYEVTTMTDPVSRFTAAIESATIPTAEVFAPDAVLDATVPNWRFTVRGASSIEHTLAGWFADPGRFETLTRVSIEGGELVRFVLTWEEAGQPHMCHQAHVAEIEGDRVVRDTVYCGGDWDAALMAEMAEADAALV